MGLVIVELIRRKLLDPRGEYFLHIMMAVILICLAVIIGILVLSLT